MCSRGDTAENDLLSTQQLTNTHKPQVPPPAATSIILPVRALFTVKAPLLNENTTKTNILKRHSNHINTFFYDIAYYPLACIFNINFQFAQTRLPHLQ